VQDSREKIGLTIVPIAGSETMAKLGPIFRCTGMDQVAATEDGRLAMVEIIEVDGRRLTISLPPDAAQVLANRFLAAAEIARSRTAAGPLSPGQQQAAPAPLATDHRIEVSDDATHLAVTFRTGTSPLAVGLSATRSAKLRTDLEAAEAELEKKRKQTRN
jgi:hypothetical protein